MITDKKIMDMAEKYKQTDPEYRQEVVEYVLTNPDVVYNAYFELMFGTHGNTRVSKIKGLEDDGLSEWLERPKYGDDDEF